MRRLTKSINSTGSSSGGSFERNQDVINPDKGLLQHHQLSMKREENVSVFPTLKLLDYTPNIDVFVWMKKGHPVSARSASPHSFTHISLTHSSKISRPCTTLVCHSQAIAHAKLADDVGVDPCPIVKRLIDETTWTRWIALKEDIPEGTKTLAYTAHRGPSSWAKAIHDDPTRKMPSMSSPMSPGGIDPNCSPQRILDFDYRSRKRRSIALSISFMNNDEKCEVRNVLFRQSKLPIVDPETVLSRKRTKLGDKRKSIARGMLSDSISWTSS